MKEKIYIYIMSISIYLANKLSIVFLNTGSFASPIVDKAQGQSLTTSADHDSS